MEPRKWELFECQRCGICCTGIDLPPYDPLRILEIANFLEVTIEQVIESYYVRFSEKGKSCKPGPFMAESCPFLSTKAEGKKVCKIYPVRPSACRLYPFEITYGLGCPAARNVYDKIRKEEA